MFAVLPHRVVQVQDGAAGGDDGVRDRDGVRPREGRLQCGIWSSGAADVHGLAAVGRSCLLGWDWAHTMMRPNP